MRYVELMVCLATLLVIALGIWGVSACIYR
jgi:hypothetical protein